MIPPAFDAAYEASLPPVTEGAPSRSRIYQSNDSRGWSPHYACRFQFTWNEKAWKIAVEAGTSKTALAAPLPAMRESPHAGRFLLYPTQPASLPQGTLSSAVGGIHLVGSCGGPEKGRIQPYGPEGCGWMRGNEFIMYISGGKDWKIKNRRMVSEV